MKFHGKITVARYAEDNWNPEITEIFGDYFESRSIQSAKAHLTKLANETELFSSVQSKDNEEQSQLHPCKCAHLQSIKQWL